MQRDPKIILLAATIALMLGSCSGSRKIVRQANPRMRTVQSITGKELIMNNTLAGKDFEISKFRAKVTTGEDNNSFSGYLRHSGDSYLISIRTIAGIEAARIYFDRDSVKINDRINRQYIHGRFSALRSRYGIDWDDIPLLLGDITTTFPEEQVINCIGGFGEYTNKEGNKLYQFTMSCAEGRLTEVSVIDGISGRSLRAFFKSFIRENGLVYPGFIIIESGGTKAEISIERVNSDSKPTIKFRKGSGYDELVIR